MEWSDIESDEPDNPYGNIGGLKSVNSSTDIGKEYFGVPLRETHSFTGALEELRIDGTKKPLKPKNPAQVHISNNASKPAPGMDVIQVCRGEDGNFTTHDKQTHNIFMVSDDMLVYQGRRYMPADIANSWKKDCRMWLWKARMKKRKALSAESDMRKRSKTALKLIK